MRNLWSRSWNRWRKRNPITAETGRIKAKKRRRSKVGVVKKKVWRGEKEKVRGGEDKLGTAVEKTNLRIFKKLWNHLRQALQMQDFICQSFHCVGSVGRQTFKQVNPESDSYRIQSIVADSILQILKQLFCVKFQQENLPGGVKINWAPEQGHQRIMGPNWSH
jgi:hypothetical protein